MIRIVTKYDNAGMACNVGGSVHSQIKTFDVEVPELEAYLKSVEGNSYSQVQVIGVEVMAASPLTGGCRE